MPAHLSPGDSFSFADGPVVGTVLSVRKSGEVTSVEIERNPSPPPPPKKKEIWFVIELVGRQKVAGRIVEDHSFGEGLIGLDVPFNGGFVRQYISAAHSVWRMTEVSAEIARKTQDKERLSPDFSLTVDKCLDDRAIQVAQKLVGGEQDSDDSEDQGTPFG